MKSPSKKSNLEKKNVLQNIASRNLEHSWTSFG
jgi:hypothetical protein